MNARVEVYMDGRLVVTLPAKSVARAHLSAEYQRWQGFHALVIYGRA
jgi:hypothetical protein